MNWIKLEGGAEVFLNDSTGVCKSCGKRFLWGVTKKNKWMPVTQNEDGTYISHFSDCSGASKHRKNKA